MNEEENVGVENAPTEEIAAANAGGNDLPKEETLSFLGKFKDADALARAYESLQAEFTRRSQRLKSLEREMENFKRQSSGAEKLRKTAKARREESKQFDAFLSEVCAPANEKPVSERASTEDFENAGALPAGDVATAAGEGNLQKGREQEENVASTKESKGEPSAEELFQSALQNEEVRLRIVGEYLSSLGKSGAPLTSGATGALITPAVKAKSVGQAGEMALRYFRKPTLD